MCSTGRTSLWPRLPDSGQDTQVPFSSFFRPVSPKGPSLRLVYYFVVILRLHMAGSFGTPGRKEQVKEIVLNDFLSFDFSHKQKYASQPLTTFAPSLIYIIPPDVGAVKSLRTTIKVILDAQPKWLLLEWNTPFMESPIVWSAMDKRCCRKYHRIIRIIANRRFHYFVGLLIRALSCWLYNDWVRGLKCSKLLNQKHAFHKFKIHKSSMFVQNAQHFT